jgi:hypothetical protein
MTPNSGQPQRKCVRYRSMSEIDRFVFPSHPLAGHLATPTLGVGSRFNVLKTEVVANYDS